MKMGKGFDSKYQCFKTLLTFTKVYKKQLK